MSRQRISQDQFGPGCGPGRVSVRALEREHSSRSLRPSSSSRPPKLHPSLSAFFLPLLLAMVFCGQARGQMLVHRITVTNVGPAAVSEGLIRANIHVKEGQPYNRSAIDEDIKNLYLTGYFQDVRVTEQPTAEGINLVYFLDGKPKLTDIIFVGNKKYSNKKLLKKL